MRNSPIYCFIAGLQASENYRLDASLLSYNYDFFLKLSRIQLERCDVRTCKWCVPLSNN